MACNRAPGTGNTIPPSFSNWAGTVSETPQRFFQPETLDQLVAIVKQAEAEGVRVRAVGSGWSFTDIMTTPDYMVNTNKLQNILSETVNPNASYPNDPVFGALRPAVKNSMSLFHVEAGIKLQVLHDTLESNYRPNPGQAPPPGVMLNDGPGGSLQPHGYALLTLGGSGGQSLAGAISTSVHGGDDHDVNGPIRPVPDMIHGIYLVAARGVEFFIQRGGQQAIVDPNLLAQLAPCLAGHITSNNDVFNSVVTSMGRMGIIYSLVVEVRQQYVLKEIRFQDTWNNVKSNTLPNLRNNRFLQILILPYSTSQETPPTPIGGNTTASTPFVVPDANGAWVYFQGTDTTPLRGPGTLWKVRDDGTQQSQIGNNTTASTPFVVPDPNGGAWVYFRGTDDTLWKVRDDGTQQFQIGNNTSASTPFVVPDPNGGAWVYFQGTDTALFRGPGTLWKVRDDGTQQSQIGNNTTASTPFVIPDPNGGAWVYFQGTDDTLWKVRDDGTQQSQIGSNTTASTPFVVPDPNGGAWVYFRGTDDTLWKVRDDGTQQSQIGNNKTISTPFVMPDPNGNAWVYFQGTDSTLWRVRDDGSQQTQVGGNSTLSTPFVTPNGFVYFQGTDFTLWKAPVNNDHACFVTTRNEVPQPSGPPTPPSGGFDPFTFGCEAAGPELANIVIGVINGLLVAAAALLAIPVVGPILAAADLLLIALLTPLTDPSVNIDEYLGVAVNLITRAGRMDLAQWIVNTILSNAQGSHTVQDLGYKIMDTFDYNAKCHDNLGMEVAFNADGPAYFDYLDKTFQMIDDFARQNILYGGYISLRYCAGSDALLSIEQWPHTVCIEFGALGNLAQEAAVLHAFEQEAVNRGGIVHWGQVNTRTKPDIEAAFPGKIDTWRATLAHLSRFGNANTFDNDYCIARGLEPIDVKRRTVDLSYLFPLLLSDPE